jgi:4-hydroxy-tetrahydrodipicolinate synthase
MEQLHGVIPPVSTPFTDDLLVDTTSLERLVKHLLDGGVHGLFALGSTSETVFLTPKQRNQVLETVVSAAQGKVPVVAGVMAMTTSECVAHGLEAKRLGANGLVLTMPFYTRTSQFETIEHFRLVARATGLPIIAYDIPVCVGNKLAPETLKTLFQEGLIVALKDSSGDDTSLRRLALELRGSAARLLTGSELMVDTALYFGAHGVVPGLGNVDPHGYTRLYQHAVKADWQAAKLEQERLIRLFEIVNAASIPGMSPGANAMGGFKTALMLRGIIASNAVGQPQTRYDEAGVRVVAKLLAEAGLS